MLIRRVAPYVGGAVWLLLVWQARVRGIAIAETPRVAVGAAPVVGQWLWSPNAGFVWAGALGALGVAYGPRLADRLPWRALLVGVVVVGALWTVSLASTEGVASIAEPLETRYEYLAVLDEVDAQGVGSFVSDYTDRLGEYPTHVKGHPPAATLAFVVLDRIGLGGPGWAAALVIGMGASAAAAALIALRAVADEATARRAAPFLALLPGAVWLGTSADAMFAGVIAWGVAIVSIAVERSSTSSVASQKLALAGGVVGALGLFLTYGAVPLLLIPAVLVVRARAWRVLLFAVTGAIAVTVAFLAAGFWWFDGVDATRTFYEAGVSQRREYGYFVLLGNPAAFALAIGPAAFAGIAALRDRRAWWIVGAALGAVVVADVSGLSKGEVERIWLPYAPWLVVSALAFRSRIESRLWLAANVTTGVVVEAWLFSPW